MKNSKRNHTKNAYKNAINSALYGVGKSMHNPAVKYDEHSGFFVESSLMENNSRQSTIWEANFSASTGLPYCAPAYEDIEIEINK